MIKPDPSRSSWGWGSWILPTDHSWSRRRSSILQTLRPGRGWTSWRCRCTSPARRSGWLRFIWDWITAWTGFLSACGCTWSREEDEEDWVEESDGIVYDPLMDDCWNEEGGELDDYSSFAESWEKAIEIKIHVVVQPVMNDDVPFPVIWAELNRVPPIGIESSVRETSQFWP